MTAFPTTGSTAWDASLGSHLAVSTDPTTGKIKNEALQVADTAPIADEALANKKYVDDTNASGSSPTTNDSDINVLVKDHAYQAQTGGFVTALDENTAETIKGWVGSTSDPVGAGIRIASSQVNDANGDVFISFFVAKGNYFEITKATGSVTITWSPFVTGGGNPIDNN